MLGLSFFANARVVAELMPDLAALAADRRQLIRNAFMPGFYCRRGAYTGDRYRTNWRFRIWNRTSRGQRY